MRLALVTVALLLPVASLRADPPAPVIPDNALLATPAAQEVRERLGVGGTHLDLVFGLPLALRFQTPLWHEGRSALQVELLGGLYLIFPVAGIGLRYQWEALSWNGRHLIVAPGLGGYGIYNSLRDGFFGGGPDGWGLANVDVDLVWGRPSGQFGLKLGVSTNGSTVLPLVALFAGWQF